MKDKIGGSSEAFCLIGAGFSERELLLSEQHYEGFATTIIDRWAKNISAISWRY